MIIIIFDRDYMRINLQLNDDCMTTTCTIHYPLKALHIFWLQSVFPLVQSTVLLNSENNYVCLVLLRQMRKWPISLMSVVTNLRLLTFWAKELSARCMKVWLVTFDPTCLVWYFALSRSGLCPVYLRILLTRKWKVSVTKGWEYG